MTVKRKLDGAVDESSRIEKFKNPTRLYINCEKSESLYLEEYGRQYAKKIQASLDILKACC